MTLKTGAPPPPLPIMNHINQQQQLQQQQLQQQHLQQTLQQQQHVGLANNHVMAQYGTGDQQSQQPQHLNGSTAGIKQQEHLVFLGAAGQHPQLNVFPPQQTQQYMAGLARNVVSLLLSNTRHIYFVSIPEN